jgi:hypothetical protein
MEKKDLIENEIEKTLSSLGGISRAEANPFLYTKIANRIGKAEQFEKKFNFKFALGVVISCIVINLAAYLFIPQYINTDTYTTPATISADTRESQIKSFASEYSSINNIYFY